MAPPSRVKSFLAGANAVTVRRTSAQKSRRILHALQSALAASAGESGGRVEVRMRRAVEVGSRTSACLNGRAIFEPPPRAS